MTKPGARLIDRLELAGMILCYGGLVEGLVASALSAPGAAKLGLYAFGTGFILMRPKKFNW